MKFISVLIIILTIGLSGCSNWRGSVQASSSSLAQERKDWQAQIEQRLKNIDRQMDDLVSKANTDARVAKMKDRGVYYDRMARLEKERTDTRQKYEALRKTTDQKWLQAKGEVEQAAEAMESAWMAFLAELNS